MKKTFLFAAIAVFSVVACQKEISTAPEGNYTVRASRESAVDTRSTVSDEGVFAWSAGDAIGLWNGSKFCELTTSTGGDASADFTGTVEGTAQSYAVYPYALNAKVESGIVKVTLPSSYEWKEGETNSPMLAECGESPTSLSFKHLGGLVKVTVKNVDADAAKFVLTADKDIAGEYSVVDEGDAKVIKSAGTEANNSVAFTFTAGTATNMAFYVPVPVGDYKFTVALQKEDGTQLWSYGGSSVNTVNRAKFILMPELTITTIPGSGEDHSGVVKESETEEIYRISTPDGLVYAAKNLFAQKKDGVYNIAADLDMTGKNYEAPKIDNVAGNFTLNGNGKTISNLGNRLIAETGSAKTVTIKDLTLDKASIKIEVTSTTEEIPNAEAGVAAFIGYAGTSENIVLENCHLANSSIEAINSSWIGGLIGYAAGFNQANNGPVFETVKITNCSVKGSTLTGGDSSVGSVIGHGIGDAATLVLIDKVEVSGNTISGNKDEKLGSVFGTVGSKVDPTAWNGQANGVHLDNSSTTIEKNTVNNKVVSGLDKLYGRNFCNLWIDGSLQNAPDLQTLLSNGGTITLESDYTGDFSVPAGVKVELNLNGHKITNVSGDTFTVGLGGELVVNGEGTVDNVSHGRSCIYNNGTVTLNGGKYTRSKEASTSTSSSGGNSYYNILNHGDLTINEGVEVYSTGAFSSLIDNGYYNYKDSDPRSGYVDGTNNAAPSLTIKGGKFSGGINTIKNDDGATLTIEGGDFSNTTQACVQNNNVATISGGTFKPAQGGHSVESNKYAGENNKGETSISGGTFDGPLYTYDGGSFKISGGTFNDMSVEAGKAAGNIIFASDYELASPVILKSGSLTVDLGSQTLEASKSSTIEVSGKGTCTTAFEVKKGTALTVKNGNIGNAGSNIFYGVHSSGGDVTLESVTFGELATYAFNGGGKLTASGCTFKGWLSGWNEGGAFNKCTFTIGKAYYPAAICYGSTEFNECLFFKNGVDPDEYGNGNKRDDDGFYRCNYVVSACQPTTTIDFKECKFIDADGKNTESLTSENHPYLSTGWGDGKPATANIKVDGKAISNK